MILKQGVISVWMLVIHHSEPKSPYMDVIMVVEINYGTMIM